MIAPALGLLALICLVVFMATTSSPLVAFDSPVDNPELYRARLREAFETERGVRMSQTTLHRLGYLKGNPALVIDGIVGPATRDAMNAFAEDVWAKRRARTVPAHRQVR